MPIKLRKSLLKRLARIKHRDGFFIAHERDAHWLLNHHNFVDRQFGVFHSFEPRQIDRLLAPGNAPCDVFVDIGANFGLYSVLAAKRKRAAQVIAFEPDPRNHAQLHANLYLNGLTHKVTVRQEAVSDREGDVGLALHSEGSTGQTRIADHGGDTFTVPCITIDSQFAWHGLSILFKVDIEGHELSAIKGMERTLQDNNCTLQVEVFPENFEAVDTALQALGYAMVDQIDLDRYYRPKSPRRTETA